MRVTVAFHESSPKFEEKLDKQSYPDFTQIMENMQRKAEKHSLNKGFIYFAP